MCTGQQTITNRTLEIELVDNWHSRWREVLDAIDFVGQRQCLQIDSDGWLSARHNLLVILIDDAIAGHVSFSVQVDSDEECKPHIEAHLDALGVQPGFDHAEVSALLRAAAAKRAQTLRCQRFIGLE